MQGPINPATRARGNETVEIKDDLNALWGMQWIKGYVVVFGLLGGTYAINHIFDWGGMITNTFIFMMYGMILAPVLTAPSIAGVVTIAGLFGRDVPQAFKTYLGDIAPNIAFWSLLALGAMAWFPWHFGAWWAGPLVMAISLFLVIHTWKYVTDAKIVKKLSLWYAIGVLLVGLTFALGLDKPIENLINRVNPPSTFNVETGATQRMMNSRTGEVFTTLSPDICEARAKGVCYDGETGEVLVPYNTSLVSVIQKQNRPTTTRSSTAASAKPSDVRIAALKSCDLGELGWSEEIPVEDGYKISPGFSLDSLGVRYLSLDNGWVNTHPGTGRFVAISFCADNHRIVGRSMGVTFPPKV